MSGWRLHCLQFLSFPRKRESIFGWQQMDSRFRGNDRIGYFAFVGAACSSFTRVVLFVLASLVSCATHANPPQRLVSLAPSITELTYAAGAGDLLVAASAFSDFPEDAKKLPQIADAAGIHWERLLALKPDLVLVWESGTRAQDVQRLSDLKIPTLTLSVRKLDDLPRAIESIGLATGRATPARAEARRIRQAIENTKQPVTRERVRVFIEISALPLMTVNRDHVLSEIVTRCGGENVFADAPTLVAEPSREALIARKPQILLRPQSKVSDAQAAYLPQGIANPPISKFFTPDWAFRPGPRLIDAKREICGALDLTGAAKVEK
jgi:ABC-type Fe3+-hydroxamate transport system substrate-binding protein